MPEVLPFLNHRTDIGLFQIVSASRAGSMVSLHQRVLKMRKLKKFCGRYVRLKNAAFRTVLERAHRNVGLENLFVVAAISSGMDKLICYGSDMRVVVSPCDVVMV